MTQAQALVHAGIVGNRKHTSCLVYTVALDDHCTIVKWRILEENLFDETSRDASIDLLSLRTEIIKVIVALNHYQCSDFLLRHVATGMNQIIDPLVVVVLLKV